MAMAASTALWLPSCSSPCNSNFLYDSGGIQNHRSACAVPLRRVPRKCLRARIVCSHSDEDVKAEVEERLGDEATATRRGMCLAGMGGLLASALPDGALAKEVAVGEYLPKAGVGDFVFFQPSVNQTPALRAGNVPRYSFYLPPGFVPLRIANIASGNYCQPKCAEPWTEVKFEDPKVGTVTVLASPMVRLTNRPNSSIEEIGTPDRIIAALGPFVTGDSYDPEEVVEMNTSVRGDQTYYSYTLETPYAKSGAHNLAAVSAKGDAVMLLVISANDKQWGANEQRLRTVLDSFTI